MILLSLSAVSTCTWLKEIVFHVRLKSEKRVFLKSGQGVDNRVSQDIIINPNIDTVQVHIRNLSTTQYYSLLLIMTKILLNSSDNMLGEGTHRSLVHGGYPNPLVS